MSLGGIFMFVIFGTLLGGVAGWIVGLFFADTILGIASQLGIVRAARVSYDAAWRAGEDEKGDEKLLRYLWKNQHTTPFEAATLTLEVKAPIFVFRQWHRHRTQSYNELSARYRELPEEYYVPEVLTKQSTNNKQGRTDEPIQNEAILREMMHNRMSKSFRLYRSLIEVGVSREIARSVLPVATYSHMFTTMNLLNLFRFLTLRADAHAQMEIRAYAEAIVELVRPHFPVCVAAWEENR